MVSQPTMRFILAPRTCLLGLMAALFLFVACGQNEGGRCQVNSDCASGLKCNSTTGNGQCVSQSTVPANNDAALAKDEAEDQPAVSGSELGIDTVVTQESDAETIDAEALSLDAGAVDSVSVDSTAD